MRKTETINRNQLFLMLINWKFGSQPVSIQYVTNPKIKKAGKEKFGEITKVAAIGGLLGYDYQNSVNNQRERENKEQNFESGQIWNGKGKKINNCLVKHTEKGTFYVAYKHQQTFRSFYFDDLLQPVKHADLNEFFYASSSKKQNLDQEVNHRYISLENIRRLKMKGVTYILKGQKPKSIGVGGCYLESF